MYSGADGAEIGYVFAQAREAIAAFTSTRNKAALFSEAQHRQVLLGDRTAHGRKVCAPLRERGDRPDRR